MRITTILVAALSLAFLSACDRDHSRPAASGSSAAPRNEAAPAQNTPSAPVTSSVNSGKRESTPPVTGREDTREPAQRRDFQHPDSGGK
jgi:hypothetical protein